MSDDRDWVPIQPGPTSAHDFYRARLYRSELEGEFSPYPEIPRWPAHYQDKHNRENRNWQTTLADQEFRAILWESRLVGIYTRWAVRVVCQRPRLTTLFEKEGLTQREAYDLFDELWAELEAFAMGGMV